jgi:hypothetical protein
MKELLNACGDSATSIWKKKNATLLLDSVIPIRPGQSDATTLKSLAQPQTAGLIKFYFFCSSQRTRQPKRLPSSNRGRHKSSYTYYRHFCFNQQFVYQNNCLVAPYVADPSNFYLLYLNNSLVCQNDGPVIPSVANHAPHGLIHCPHGLQT